MKNKFLTGIVGDKPSTYSKSPVLWNAAFKAVAIDAEYLPFDVAEKNLESFVKSMRQNPSLLGFNVTMPYKVRIIEFLDELDLKAKKIGAVNTVVRTKSGRLVGSNTDGQGALDSLTKVWPDEKKAFLPSLVDLRVLLLGAGGAARATAFAMAEAIGKKGQLIIINRDKEKADELSEQIRNYYGNTESAAESRLPSIAIKSDLIVNTTTVGQSGVHKLLYGMATFLEPYCPLAPVSPPSLRWPDFPDEAAFSNKWYELSAKDIQINEQKSRELIDKIPSNTAFFDLIYSPSETRFLKYGRESGKLVLNGRRMIIGQAVESFVNYIMKSEISKEKFNLVFESMAHTWAL